MPQDNLEIKDRPRSDYYLFILVLTTVSIIAAKYVYQIRTGPDWDTYSFCINALEFAGRGTGHYEYDRGLFFPFLLSILFRLGFVTEKAA
ncbi:MAG: hypothetical protein JW825_04950, partial [Candidatus Methanofastidiosa archaeon]|nr:hypothetical protein [Candidatus Methanofastidiosa archaeon]